MRASIAILIGAIILCAQAQEDLRKQFLVASVRKLSTFLYLYLYIHQLCNIFIILLTFSNKNPIRMQLSIYMSNLHKA